MLKIFANLENKAYIADGNMLLVDAHHESGLPDDYILVDGIQDASTSTPISTSIVTDIVDDVDDMEYEVYFKCASLGNWAIVGAGYGGGQSRKYGFKWSATSYNDYGIAAYLGNSPLLTSSIRRRTSTSSRSYKYLLKFTHKQGNASLYVYDEYRNEEDTQTATYTYTASSSSNKISLFMASEWENIAAKNDTIYYVKIKKSGVLVANYIPCTYNNTAGFYDLVTQTFKTPSSGSVTAGDEVSDPYVI